MNDMAIYLALAIYAEQPIINECKPLVARLLPKRKRRDPYELVTGELQ